jgi:hypothetical protein
MATDYNGLDKEQSIAQGYNDLALAIIKSGVKEDEDYLGTQSGLFWKQIFILSDEIYSGYIVDNHIARMEQPNIDD